jgi:hypothetical protein
MSPWVCWILPAGCFCLGLSNGRCNHIDPSGRLFVLRLLFVAVVQRKIKEAFAEAVWLVGCLAQSDNGRFQLGFAFCFLICQIDTVEISIAKFSEGVQMCPEMVEKIVKPAFFC